MAWKPKIFIIWPSTEKIGWPLLYKKPFQIFLIDYNIDDIKKKQTQISNFIWFNVKENQMLSNVRLQHSQDTYIYLYSVFK